MPRSTELDISDSPDAREGAAESPRSAASPMPADRDLRVPKLRVKARARLRGQEPRTVVLHLGERAALHSGPERPSDLLAGSCDFLPVGGPQGRVLFLSTHAIDVLTVPAGLEADPAVEVEDGSGSSVAVERDITVHLDDGSEVEGHIRFLPPPGRARLLDFLNGPAPFLPVREGELVHLVNKSRVSWITAVADADDSRVEEQP